MARRILEDEGRQASPTGGVETIKGAYKHKEKADPHTGRRHIRKRDRKTGLFFVLVACALLVVMIADSLLNGGEILRTFRLGEPATGEKQESATSTQEAASSGRASGSEPNVLLGEFYTDYAWDPDPSRQSNLKKASKKIDGVILAPGETFSALDTLGPPEDYETAKVFANGGVDRTEGGGLCQISSTLFMAANYAGLEIVERNPHYAELPYIQPGLDATVWFGEKGNGWGALNMRFKNNTDGNIMLREYVNDKGFLVAQIYGEKPTGKRVSMDSEKVEENPNKGIKWATYKTVVDSNGKKLEDGLLYETVYSYNPPTPAEMKHKTYEPRGSGWLDPSNTTGWANNH